MSIKSKRISKGLSVYAVIKSTAPITRYIIAQNLKEALEILEEKEPGTELASIDNISLGCLVYMKE